jgi:hypothetical protein
MQRVALRVVSSAGQHPQHGCRKADQAERGHKHEQPIDASHSVRMKGLNLEFLPGGAAPRPTPDHCRVALRALVQPRWGVHGRSPYGPHDGPGAHHPLGAVSIPALVTTLLSGVFMEGPAFPRA